MGNRFEMEWVILSAQFCELNMKLKMEKKLELKSIQLQWMTLDSVQMKLNWQK